jgi:hypothetical protein
VVVPDVSDAAEAQSARIRATVGRPEQPEVTMPNPKLFAEVGKQYEVEMHRQAGLHRKAREAKSGGRRPQPKRALYFGVMRRRHRVTFGAPLNSLPVIEA